MDDASADPAERLKQQRRRLHKRLGLDGQMQALLDTKELVKDEDLVASGGGGGGPAQPRDTKQAAELLGEMEGRGLSSKSLLLPLLPCLPFSTKETFAADDTVLATGCSAREKARLKRLAKKRPAEGSAQKGGGKRQQVGKGGTDTPSAEVRRQCGLLVCVTEGTPSIQLIQLKHCGQNTLIIANSGFVGLGGCSSCPGSGGPGRLGGGGGRPVAIPAPRRRPVRRSAGPGVGPSPRRSCGPPRDPTQPRRCGMHLCRACRLAIRC